MATPRSGLPFFPQLTNPSPSARPGLNSGHATTPLAMVPKPSYRKGKLSARSAFVKALVREVAGFAPYERRVMELIRNSKVRIPSLANAETDARGRRALEWAIAVGRAGTGWGFAREREDKQQSSVAGQNADHFLRSSYLATSRTRRHRKVDELTGVIAEQRRAGGA
ncbi:large subunit ribosomal protein L36e, partial [Phenoliferia sp. Uapishka_3]